MVNLAKQLFLHLLPWELGSGDASHSMALKQQDPWALALGLCSIGWHGRTRVTITRGQIKGNSTSHFLCFNKTLAVRKASLLTELRLELFSYYRSGMATYLSRQNYEHESHFFFNAMTKRLRELKGERFISTHGSVCDHWALLLLGFNETEPHGGQLMIQRLAARFMAVRKLRERYRGRS